MPSIHENQDCVDYKLCGILYSLSVVAVWFYIIHTHLNSSCVYLLVFPCFSILRVTPYYWHLNKTLNL